VPQITHGYDRKLSHRQEGSHCKVAYCRSPMGPLFKLDKASHSNDSSIQISEGGSSQLPKRHNQYPLSKLFSNNILVVRGRLGTNKPT
jgi:hypothetical protein